jgi:hypothetical protein
MKLLFMQFSPPYYFIPFGLNVLVRTPLSNIEDIHKRMVRFQKLLKHLLLALHVHNIHCLQRELPKFLMRYQ